jgi:hypothetical protein
MIMNKFIVLFLAPSAVMAEWMKKPQSERDGEEKKMREEWNEWMKVHAAMIKETNAAGKTKRVSAKGIEDARNDIMLYSIVEGESHEAVARAYEGHPHFGIPEATIEITAIRPM